VVTSCDETDSAYKLFAGYKFNKNFAIEGSYVDFGEFTAKDAVSGVKARAEVDSFGIAVMGILPVAKHFDLFAKLGFHSWDTKAVATGNNVRATEDDSGTDVVYGLGASYSFTDSVAIRAEWENYDSEDDVNVISAGLTYSF
jgi:OOP family OmpA-OmpF porin